MSISAASSRCNLKAARWNSARSRSRKSKDVGVAACPQTTRRTRRSSQALITRRSHFSAETPRIAESMRRDESTGLAVLRLKCLCDFKKRVPVARRRSDAKLLLDDFVWIDQPLVGTATMETED